MNEWINTSEDLPIVGEDVLFVWREKVRIGYYRGYTGYSEVWEVYTQFGAQSVQAKEVEKWMPLPSVEDTRIAVNDPYAELCEQLGVEP